MSNPSDTFLAVDDDPGSDLSLDSLQTFVQLDQSLCLAGEQPSSRFGLPAITLPLAMMGWPALFMRTL